jgi:benzoyl-CoA reductase/2-hydroxyglutaryl-CoA dehydratase subunit BcrC/BadD/HgdB
MLMLKEEHNQLLRSMLQDLEKRSVIVDKRARIVLSGGLCQAPQLSILNLIEKSGMVIVDDDLYVGSRYFLHDAKSDEDPFVALTDRYLERVPPSPTRVDTELDWGDYILRMVTQNEAAGVINLVVKYCPPHLAYYPDIERKLSRAGIHSLMLEMEHELSSLEQVKTRVQAFGESLE